MTMARVRRVRVGVRHPHSRAVGVGFMIRVRVKVGVGVGVRVRVRFRLNSSQGWIYDEALATYSNNDRGMHIHIEWFACRAPNCDKAQARVQARI